MSEQSVERPVRGRAPRADAVAGERRRRKPGTLDRMVQYKLDYIAPEDLDLENYVYRWANDEPGRLRMLTKHDDYDHVSLSDMGPGFNPEGTDSESSERIRMLTGTDKHGNPSYAYLLKKPRPYWVDDNEAIVDAREAMMEGRVYHGEAVGDPTGNEKIDPSVTYVPGGNSIGGIPRRRGPVA